MDPATIAGLVSSTITLATVCGSVAKDLNTLLSGHKNARLAILSMVQGLDTMQLAWSRIGKWAEDQTTNGLLEEDNFIGRLRRSLETGSLVMDALGEELLIYKPLEMGLAQRTKVVWNEGTLRSHQERIRDQSSSMTLLLQAINLPTLGDRNDLLRGSEKQFKISDESAYSIVPSDMSTSIYTHRTNGSKGEEDLEYKPLTFENELFTSRVYKRNYAMPAIRRLSKKQKTSDKTRPPLVPQETAEDPDGSVAEILTIREPGRTQQRHNEAQSVSAPPTGGQLIWDEDTDRGETNPSSNAPSSMSFGEACEQGNIEVVETFLKSGSNVHAPALGKKGPFLDLHPIHLASKSGHIQIVEILLSHGADKEMLSRVSGGRPLHLAVKAGHLDMVRCLLDNGANIASEDGNGFQAIHLAAEGGSTEILSLLLDCGAAINSATSNGAQALHMASRNLERANVIRFLCSRGADIEAKTYYGCTPLCSACLENAVDNMEALLELGAAHSPQGPSNLAITLSYGYSQAARLLLEHGSDPNSPISGRPSALHVLTLSYSCTPEHVEIGELLLAYGADVSLQDSDGDTPLHCLCSRGVIPITRRRLGIKLAILLSKSMRDVDAFNFAGNTALGISVKNKSDEWLAKPLIDSGSRLLLRKPHIELGLNLHRSAGGEVFHLDCYVRKGSCTSIMRLGIYPERLSNNLFQLERRMDMLRHWLRNPERLDLTDDPWLPYDGPIPLSHRE